MDCKRSSQLLNAYADSELSKSDQSLLESHLAECRTCTEELEDIRKLDAQMRAEAPSPESLRSTIADRLENAKRPSRTTLKEMFGMKFRIGLAALVAAGLIVVGVMSTGGNAQAALSRMRKAVTQVHSSHLRIELNEPIDLGDNDKKDGDSDSMDLSGMLGKGGKSIDVYSEGNRWKVNVFSGIEVIYKDGFVSVMMGDKVFAHVKADKADMPTDMSDYLFKSLSKATDELNQKYNVRQVGEIHDGGQNLKQLEVTGLKDDGKNFRLEYWVDEDTNLPSKFEVWAKDESGQQKLVANITCEFNQNYPDSMFEPGGVEKP
jgi:hypothetical protein